MKKLFVLLLTFTYLVTVNLRAQSTSTNRIKLEPGVHCDVVSRVVTNLAAPLDGRRIFLLHGLASTSEVFDNLIAAIQAGPDGNSIRLFIVIDLPGHGKSGLPSGNINVRFGDLDIYDDVAAVAGVLDNYKKLGISPSEIVAHSMAGLVIQVLQDALLANGQSLKKTYGVTKVTLIGSSSPSEVLDPLLEAQIGLALLSSFTTNNAVLGTYALIDAGSFQSLFFLDRTFTTIPSAPSVEEVQAGGYYSNESYAAALQTVGTADMRPSVHSGIFAPSNGTTILVLVGEQDFFSDIDSEKALCKHLAGFVNDTNFATILGDDQVHDGFIPNPGPLATFF